MMDDESITTWGYMRRMSDYELRAMLIMTPADDENATVEDVRGELERRERERLYGRVHALLLITTLCWIVIALCILALTLSIFNLNSGGIR